MSAVFPFVTWHWTAVDRCHPAARALADRHYSRQTPGAVDFLPPGRTFCLLTHDQLAVWGVVENLDPAGNPRWRCTIFRREAGPRASDLIAEATARTVHYWRVHYGALPRVPLQTEVDPARTRSKRDPGRCFRRAGWTVAGERRGLVILQAPGMGGGLMLALELNSCAGGMALGAREAGIEFAVSIDWDEDACATYEAGLGHRPLRLDIRELARLAAAGWAPAQRLDLLVADPPCTPWSRAGSRRGVEDERDLIHVTVDLVRALRPRCWLIANVPGLDDGPNWPVVQQTIGSLQDAYAIDFRRLDAADYGVPQHRVRPFWFGRWHNTAPIAWPLPTHGDPTEIGHHALGDLRVPWVTCRQALGHLPPDELGKPIRLRKRACSTKQHGSVPERPARVVGTSNLSDGNVLLTAGRAREGHPVSELDAPAKVIPSSQPGNGGAVLAYGRGDHHRPSEADAPARTLTRNTHSDGALLTHPKHPINRPDEPAFTVTARDTGGAQGGQSMEWPWDRPATGVTTREAAGAPGHHGHSEQFGEGAIKLSERAALILQGFPDGYWIAGKTKRARWSQIGQAMPPPLSAAVFRSIARWFTEHDATRAERSA